MASHRVQSVLPVGHPLPIRAARSHRCQPAWLFGLRPRQGLTFNYLSVVNTRRTAFGLIEQAFVHLLFIFCSPSQESPSGMFPGSSEMTLEHRSRPSRALYGFLEAVGFGQQRQRRGLLGRKGGHDLQYGYLFRSDL